MACDWCDRNAVVEKVDEDTFLCDECLDEWGRMEYYSSRTE